MIWGALLSSPVLSADNRIPIAGVIAPPRTTAGADAFTLTIYGLNFVPGSVVRWNGANRATRFQSSDYLTTDIAAGDVATAGTAAVTVFNPEPGGGSSQALTFTIENPVSVIEALAPAAVNAGATAFTLTVLGGRFFPSSTVRWNGSDRATTWVSTSRLTAEILASDVSGAGTAQITVSNPGPGGGLSGGRSFPMRGPDDTPGPSFGPSVIVKLTPIPATAEIVYLALPGRIFTIDRYGQSVTQITFDPPRPYEHVAVSHDRRFVAATEMFGRNLPPKLWIFDLERGTETQVVPEWTSAGFGGIDWDSSGYLYFGAFGYSVPEGGTSNLNDLYRVKYDGTGLKRLLRSDITNDGDARVSPGETSIVFVREFLVDTRDSYTEIWTMTSDGTNPVQLAYGGQFGVNGSLMGIANIQNPIYSPNSQTIVFDRKNDNPAIPANFGSTPDAVAPFDIWAMPAQGGKPVRLTTEGPMSARPNWKYLANGTLKGDLILYTLVCECADTKDPFGGAAIIFATGPYATQDQVPMRIKSGALAPRWIP